MLAAMGLATEPDHAATKEDVLATIRRMAVLQIDTINVVARSPYLVLWSRLGDYDQRWLDELLTEGALFEYWAHAACFLPIEEYPLFRRRMLDYDSLLGPASRAWLAEHANLMDEMLATIRERGVVRSADFARTDGKVGSWWNWKDEKRALEFLFYRGDVMIARRHNFQRVYDLRERVLPGWDDTRLPSAEHVRRSLTLKAVRALGMSTARWVANYFQTPVRETVAEVASLAHAGLLLPVHVEGWRDTAYVHPDHGHLLARAASDAIDPEVTTLLSPFDPLVWDRTRALAVFGFAYRIECYTPESLRRYGYFTLPILRRGALIGRVDAKAHRKERRFEVKALHLESEVVVSDDLIADLASVLVKCASWHRLSTVDIRMTSPLVLASSLSYAVDRRPS